MSAIEGDTGSELWQRDQPFYISSQGTFGDMTGDGIKDLVVSDFYACITDSAVAPGVGPCFGSVQVGDHGARRRLSPGNVALLDASSGATLRESEATVTFPVGDPNKDGFPDIGTQTVELTRRRISVSYRAFDYEGREFYSHSRNMSFSSRDQVRVLFGTLGDVDGDGAVDAGHGINVVRNGMNDPKARALVSENGLFSGLDGSSIAHRIPPGEPLRETLDGHGDDLLKHSWLEDGSLTASHPCPPRPAWHSA